MPAIFNRREPLAALHGEEPDRTRDILSAGGIQYHVKSEPLHARSAMFSGRRRACAGCLGIDLGAAFRYKFHVHSSHFEQARFLLATGGRT